MFVVISIMFAGVVIGYLLRNQKIRFIQRLISGAIILLLFLLGSQVGGNTTIMDNLGTIGVDALIITIGALLGSVLMAKLVYVKFFNRGTDER